MTINRSIESKGFGGLWVAINLSIQNTREFGSPRYSMSAASKGTGVESKTPYYQLELHISELGFVAENTAQ